MRHLRGISGLGFSSIELLVALGLFFLIVSLSIPTLAKLSRRQALLQQSRALSQDIQHLVLDAGYRRSELELRIEPDRYQALELEHSNLLYAKNFRRGVKAKIGSSAVQRLSFYPTQVVSPARITLNHDGQECHITVALRGRVRMEC